LLVYGSLLAVMALSVLLASARIERAQLADQALRAAREAIENRELGSPAVDFQRLTQQPPQTPTSESRKTDPRSLAASLSRLRDDGLRRIEDDE
jgi:type II secretory pathway pseudopilin PulG